MKKKIKPCAHKNNNTFRFQTFSERLSKINAGVIHQTRSAPELAEDSQTFFSETLDKWVDLDYTDDFNELKSDLGQEIYSLAQLVFHQERIVDVLSKHLQATSHALPAVLEFLVSLARDLQADFYPYFPRVFSSLLELLSVHNADLLENVFACLAFLFKYLWKCIVQDIKAVFRLYSPLLSSERKAYVRNFAAESFAFIIRKVPDKKKIILIMMKNLKKNPSHSIGTGQLLFEVLKGVKNQFHSCTESVLRIILEVLGDRKTICSSMDPAREAVLECSKSMAKHSSSEHCTVVWKVYSDFLLSLQNLQRLSQESNDHILAVLVVLVPFVEFKGSSLLQEPLAFTKVMVTLLKSPGISVNCISKSMDILATILQSSNISVYSDKMGPFFSEVFKIELPFKLLCEFIKKTFFKYLHLKRELLPMLLELCEENATSNDYDVLDILSNLTINEMERLETFIDQSESSSISVHFKTQPICRQPTYNKVWNDRLQANNCKLYNMIEKQLEILPGTVTAERIPVIWAALHCLPFFSEHIKNESTMEKIHHLLKEVGTILLKEDFESSLNVDYYSFLMKEILVVALKIESEKFFERHPISSLLQLLEKFPSTVPLLQVTVIYFNQLLNLKERNRIIEHTTRLYSILKTNLASSNPMVRKLTLQVLVIFDHELPNLDDEEEVPVQEKMSVFNICLQAELVSADVQNVRQKIMYLQKLEYNHILNLNPLGGPFGDAPLYYLLGCLHVNFSLLWTPVQELVKSYAVNMGKPFWEIYIPQLKSSSLLCEKTSSVPAVEDETRSDCEASLTAFFKKNFSSQCTTGHQEPDVNHYRNLLWKTLELFSEAAESKNREIVPLFLQFIQNEYRFVDSSISSAEDIRQFNSNTVDLKRNCKGGTVDSIHKLQPVSPGETDKICDIVDDQGNIKSDLTDHDMMNDDTKVLDSEMPVSTIPDEDDHPDEDIVQEKAQENASLKVTKTKKAMTKSLCYILSVFSSFTNPRAFYKEAEIRDLYLKLLSHSDEKVQKLAFDCVLTYGDKHLTTYKQNFYKLLDNKTFKTEIILFSLDSEFGVIDKSDRESILPILMRLLYGKMLSKAGANTSGRGNALLRRSIIFRFLAGCTTNELKFFFELVFAPFQDLQQSDAKEVLSSVYSSINLSSVLPLKQQISLMNTLDVVFVQLGNLTTDILPWMLKIVIAMLTTATILLDKRDQIYAGFIPLIRRLRSLGIKRLVQFFTLFESFPFTGTEIDAIFDAAIWPQLPRLMIEGQTNSSPLLKLFSVWSSNPRYFILLGKYKDNSNETTSSVLSELLKLYASPKTSASVVNAISKILERMLTLQDVSEEVMDVDETPFVMKIKISFEAKLLSPVEETSGGLNYGTLLLVPYVSSILQRLQLLMEKTLKSSSRILSSTELTILARISELVKDPHQSAILVKMLIVSLTKRKQKSQNQEMECATLETIKNLIGQVENPVQFVRSITGLFFSINFRQSRTLLCNILETVSEKNKTFLQEAKIIQKLNAWNPKFVEELDYSERMNGFQETELYLKSEANEHFQDFVLLLIQNCTYFIIHIDDPAIRDNASFTLQKMGNIMAKLMTSNTELFRHLVCDTLLERIKKGLCNKKELVRHEFIQILSSLLRSCGNYPSLQGLAQLCNEDVEVDFWENIRHIQFHRRARVMRRLHQSIQEGTMNVPHNSLSSYVLPIVSSFLYDVTYSKHSSLVDAAIELIGSICSQLPWKRYQISLMYYLGLLSKNTEHTKTTIKVLVAVLDAFHFDLSKCVPTSGSIKSLREEDEMIEEGSYKDSSSTGVINTEKAASVFITITKHLLPKLHSCLTQKTKKDEDHKVNKTDYPEDMEILRIPVALAMVKLLQKLPLEIMNQNLPGVFLKVVQFLRSRADSIRITARDTLSKIMFSVGPKYLSMLFQQMKCSLNRGYQVHVMVYTVHAVLSNMIPVLSVGDLDNCTSLLSELCNQELFDDVAEEKEVEKILRKLKEARSSKSFPIYQLLGQFVSENCLEKLVSPLVKLLSSIHNQKKVNKTQECFHQILLGLGKNGNLSGKSLLIFAYHFSKGVFEETTKGLPKKALDKRKPPSIFLIPTEPPRGGFAAKTSVKTNSHVLVEFGLQILYSVLKRKKITSETDAHLEMLNPYVSIVSNYLSSQNIKIISASLQCATCLIKFPLPALKELIGKIICNTFQLLNKYSAPGMGQGENFQMVLLCFKLLCSTLQEVPYFELTPEQLRVLLIYIDQDVHDQTRQATAFTLLKAILSRHVESAELPDVMKKISDLAITSEQDHIRTQSCQAVHLYLLEYPLKKTLTSHLTFFVMQLHYEYESGRISALEMLNSIFTTFPVSTLKKHAGLFFVPLSACLVNDASVKCRQMGALCIKNLLGKLPHSERTSLFTAVTSWLNDTKVTHQRLGAQLLGLFAESEQQDFNNRLETVLPIIKSRLSPDLYNSENEDEAEEKDLDNLLYQLLSALIKVLTVSKGLLTEPKHQAEMYTIWGFVQQHLLHAHMWVQLASCQLFGMLFAANPVESFLPACENVISNLKPAQDFYLLVDTRNKLRTLSSDFCSQLGGSCVTEAHSEQVVRNLVYLAKLIRRFPGEIQERTPEVPISVEWIFHRLRREVKAEIVTTPSSTIKRKSVIKWVAAVAVDMAKEEIEELLPSFLLLLVRELADNSKFIDPEVKTLSQEVSDLLRSLVGLDHFTQVFIHAQTSISRKKADRKIEKAIKAVRDPVVATRQKIKKNLKKIDNRKRKQELFAGHPSKNKKPKTSDLAMFS